MYETLKRLWDDGQLDESGLRRAVDVKKWITKDQFREISGLEF